MAPKSTSKIAAMLSSDSDEWGTPRPTFESIDRTFGLDLDVCARADQHMTLDYITKRENFLRRNIGGRRYWMNFPFSQAAKFTAHARAQSMRPHTLGVWLSPVRPDTRWWRDNVLSRDGKAGELLTSRFEPKTGALWLRFEKLITGIRWLEGRLKFELPPGSTAKRDPAPFPTAIIVQAHPSTSPRLEGSEWSLGWPW